MTRPDSVEAYLEGLPPDRRARLQAIREIVRAAAPEAEESIAYDMPAFRSPGGRFLVSYAAYKAHDSLFPASETIVRSLGPQITPYLAGKGTIRFPVRDPLPLDLVRRVVEIRVAEDAAARTG